MSRNGSTKASEVRSSIEASLAPLRGHLETITAALAEKEQEVSELKELKRQVERMIELADPSFEREGKPGRKNKPGATVRANKVGLANMEHIRGIIAEHADEWPDGFRATELAAYTGLDGSTIGKCLKRLAAEGTLRLDRQTGGPSGGNFYKPTRSLSAVA
jgi:hypothetical protein